MDVEFVCGVFVHTARSNLCETLGRNFRAVSRRSFEVKPHMSRDKSFVMAIVNGLNPAALTIMASVMSYQY